MIGIVLVGHAHIAQETVRAMEHVLGSQPLVATVNAGQKQDPARMAEALRSALERCDTGDGVLVLSDMFGGTPCNLAIGEAARRGRAEVVSGFNLPLLIKALALRGQGLSLSELADSVTDAGRQYIRHVRAEESEHG
ncbi:MAG: PTS sugar transporter subunit IIA [Zetaproteobacteria bacterium]|nr:MAG: PTS sugar transporter subunit IIA [Zetaproteobacteria bacterium]